jgi:molybdenum cofactor cytidylyltransferase
MSMESKDLGPGEAPTPPLVELCTVADDVEANMVLGLLRSEGIDAISSVDSDPSVLPLGSSESVRILVLDEELELASHILEEHRLKTYAVGVILAAGEGSRMGQPKGLVRIGERTLLEEVLDAYSASLARGVVVVVAPDSPVSKFVDTESAQLVTNPEPARGPLSSLWAALDQVEATADAILVHPIDVPVFDPELIDELVRHYDAGEGPIVVPTYQGRRGHPVLFGRSCFPLLRAASLETGARQVLHEHPDLVREVPTELPWVTEDLDTPQDVERFLQAWRREAASDE